PLCAASAAFRNSKSLSRLNARRQPASPLPSPQTSDRECRPYRSPEVPTAATIAAPERICRNLVIPRQQRIFGLIPSQIQHILPRVQCQRASAPGLGEPHVILRIQSAIAFSALTQEHEAHLDQNRRGASPRVILPAPHPAGILKSLRPRNRNRRHLARRPYRRCLSGAPPSGATNSRPLDAPRRSCENTRGE